MNWIALLNLENRFSSILPSLNSVASEWCGRAVAKLDLAISYLQDRRLASAAIIVANFVILEIAFRISVFAGFFLPKKESIRKVCLFALVGALTLAGNMAFVKATKIKLDPLVVTALAMGTFFVKLKLENIAN